MGLLHSITATALIGLLGGTPALTPVWADVTAFRETWDDNNGFTGWHLETCEPISQHFAIVDDATQQGNKVLRVASELRPCAGGLSTHGEPRSRHEIGRDPVRIVPYGEDFWSVKRVYVAPNWPKSDLPTPFLTVEQVILADGATHGTDYKLMIMRNNRWSFEGLSTSGMYGGKIDLGPVVPGKWVEWKIRLKRSYGSDGVLQVWQNGKLVWDKKGRTTWTDRKDKNVAWWKLGLYAVASTTTYPAIELRIDDIAVAGKDPSTTDPRPPAPQGFHIVNVNLPPK
jgi:hypothetical protein